MTINIELLGWFQDKRFEKRALNYTHQPSVHQVISDVGIPGDEVIIVLINGTIANRDDYLSDQDTITLVPLVAGG